ncbi:LysM peptidoglycan-binding domain-containing protein [Solidesulfovibrio sp.]
MPWCALFLVFLALSTSGPAAAGDLAHTARPGDTPVALARQYNVPVADILTRNQGLDPCRIRVGDTIIIPQAAPAKSSEAGAPVPPKNAALPDEETPGRRYVVAPGDNPAAIAERFGIPLEVLLRANPGLVVNRLPVGCVLTVPEGNACAPPPVAVTRPGESGSTAPLVMDFQ